MVYIFSMRDLEVVFTCKYMLEKYLGFYEYIVVCELW